YQIKDLAQVKEVPQGQIGFVKSDGKSALTLAIVKQADARMSDLKKEIHQLTETFRKDYPHIDFTITRDQTALLDYSIDNLTQNLLVGILLACLVIFFFMQDFRSPLLITLTIPISLIITLLCMFVTRISLNVISLSGIVLGVGMMVDNSIIVIDNITQKWDKGEKLKTAVIKGTNEVFTPMLSSVLTTCSVFIPLIFMSGISGALFYDQAMAVTIGLFSSLAVSLIVIPVYYYRFYKKQEKRSRNRFLSRFHLMDYEKIYENGLKWIFRHQVLTWGILIGMIAGSCGIYLVIEKRKFPPITQNDLLLNIEWNKRINAVENERRTSRLTDHLKPLLSQYTVMAGSQKFLLSHTKENSVSEAIVYLKTVHPDSIPVLKEKIRSYLENNYPEALYSTESSGNIFDMIFAEKEPTLVARIRSINGKSPEPDLLNQLLRSIRDKLPSIHIEPVAWQEVVQLLTQPDLMTLYGIDYNRLFYKLKSAFNENRIFYMNEGEYSIPVLLGEEEKTLQHILRTTTVKNDAGIDIPLSLLLRENRINDLKNIISGAEGEYYPLQLEVKEKNIPDITRQITAVVAADRNFEVSFSGSYYSNREMIKELSAILVVSLLLLYFILAAQFESLIQPLIILSEIGIDLFGALFLLWICGSSINIMSMIGIIVMCGIVINDSILKVDTINRLRKEGKGLLKAILMAGNKRLKPIIMTSLTTILAILPFLFTGNLGADLQFPLSLAIIGGMTVGTIVSVYFIPLGYYYIYKTRQS
ncbi:MAG: efflux RND transporter permease subunit, partial [Odoribacter sp.]|nr:efflux RND transporter permease subunit [Odoribacter sp.]